MEPTQNSSSLMWCNYNTVEGLITANAPVQVELGSVDIARQISQQVQLQYGNLQAVPAQPQQIIVAHQPQPPPAPPTPEPPVTPKLPKPRARTTNGERVPCDQCGKTFSCNANLRDHMRLHTGHMRVHTGERPYSCELCEHSFASAQALKNHARTHTGEKPFVCEYCQTAFTHSSSLSSHKKRCTGEKRKRGRPLGSGRKSYRKKPTGRPRGRPKKKGRYAKRGRRKNPAAEDDLVEPKEEDMTIVKAEVHAESGEETQSIPVETKQEMEELFSSPCLAPLCPTLTLLYSLQPLLSQSLTIPCPTPPSLFCVEWISVDSLR
ncbi:hypothetical protein O3P69_011553 [Scylla paramamosain]|uniref:C2H2-type domain-containing protein n=1 Tax=Scylla paramamosain TaxID=85552 RepID=A0AAW0T6C4_SCYPA